MKALTICQPYPYLILTPQAELPSGVEQKRVENRSWSTKYRGPLLIHAGASRKWLETFPQIDEEKLTFGAILGVVDLVDCVSKCVVDPITAKPDYTLMVGVRYPWLVRHSHATGPFCWILSNPRRFKDPILYKGKLGLFEVPDNVLDGAISNRFGGDK